MNKVQLVGNIVRDPQYANTKKNGVPVCGYTIAVQRRYKDENGEYPADFINCVSWRSAADFVHKYFVKGDPIGVTGELQTRKYTTKNGDERHITEVVTETVEFVGRREKKTAQDDLGFEEIDDSDLPF